MNKSTDIQNLGTHHELVISGTCKVHAEEPYLHIFTKPNQNPTRCFDSEVGPTQQVGLASGEFRGLVYSVWTILIFWATRHLHEVIKAGKNFDSIKAFRLFFLEMLFGIYLKLTVTVM